MSSPRKLGETNHQKHEDGRRVKELKTSEMTDFYFAINEHRLEKIYSMLLVDRIHPDAIILMGMSPLYFACFCGHTDIAEFLIMNGACIHSDMSVATWGQIPLFGALTGREVKEECAELLLRHKVDVNIRHIEGFTPLMFAHNSAKVTKLLLEHQADVHATKNGNTALDIARELNAGPEVIGLLEEAATKTSLRK